MLIIGNKYSLVVEVFCSDDRHAVALTFSFQSSDDIQEEVQHDVDMATPKIEEWKAHILRASHQGMAKSDVIDSLTPSQVLLIMDWAMKFLPTSFRETQRDWFGKKSKSWHVTVAITRDENNEIEVSI